MRPFPNETRRAIINECQANNATYGLYNGILTCVLEDRAYTIKYGVSDTPVTRIKTQPYLHDAEREPTNKFRIPELIDHFDEGGRTYVVMEYIKLIEAPPSTMDKRIEAALRWLLGILPPREYMIGPLGGGCILHELFNNGEAPTAFKHVKALELYCEAVRLPRLLYIMDRWSLT